MRRLRQGCVLIALVLAGAAQSQEPSADLAAQGLDRATELIVMIDSEVGIGAGIIFGRKDDQVYVATANHVMRSGMREAGTARVMLKTLPGAWLDATLMEHADPKLDLAVLRIQGLADRGIAFCTLPLDRLGDSAAARRGDPVFPVGYPNAVLWGTPVAPDLIAQVVASEIGFQSTFVARGHSGGGLITEPGKLIGMVVGDSPPFARATSIEAVLERLRGWGYPVQLHQAVDFLNTPLHQAIEQGDTALVAQLLEACAYINTYNEHGMMPLHLAAARARVEETSLLLAVGAQVNARTSEPPQTADVRLQTPLHLAAGGGSIEVVQLLLDHGAEVDAVAEDYFGRAWGGTPLHRAAEGGFEEVAALLLAHGADPDAPSTDGTPLAVATRNDRIPAMKTLVAHGANLEPSLDVPLYLAADHGLVEAVEVLLAAGANPDHEGSFGTPLHRAAKHGHPAIVDLLIEAGAWVDAVSSFDVIPLHEAVRAGHVEIAKRLLEAGADPSTRDSYGMSPAGYANTASPEMKAAFDTFSSGGAVRGGWLGVEIRAVDSETAADLGLQRAVGVVIVTTTPGAPADDGGLKPDDVILSFDGRKVRSAEALGAFVRSTAAETTVELDVVRDGQVITLPVRLGERPG